MYFFYRIIKLAYKKYKVFLNVNQVKYLSTKKVKAEQVNLTNLKNISNNIKNCNKVQ